MEIFQETYEQLLRRLNDNREQLRKIDEKLLELKADDPNYDIFKEVRGDLIEVIQLVEELIENKKKNGDNSFEDVNIGRIVEVFYKGNKRFGRIKSRDPILTSDSNTNSYLISLFGKNSETISFQFQELKLLTQFKGLSVGEKVQVLYEEDGNWYNSVIIGLNQNGYIIKYLDYDQEEAVTYDKVRIINKSVINNANYGKNSQQLNSTSIITTPGGYKIPENLLIKSYDSEKTKLEKKKKVSVIKKQQKNEIIETQAKQKQLSWKNHISKFQKNSQMI
ncbi:30 kda splicing SPF tudor domain-containing protein [Cryptosporidium ubiquitum]|uniref:30 kDa splicing SPF tudor domain-containing protein n=1 Tax=Cryptosporidium ubiquitum TaxID=857276 RepID=A0A1J4MDW7_9CRYT|nr:30 kda splicing SPF tudor domain-containing protein [Cryptosporidium ubiquitum]OII71659.1 30 kda splicing SPF tudor domain-containing protein [Cryptosporidium ubiquitum]